MKARPGYSANKDKVLARLRRIEGQVRGIEKMVEEERYCIDVLTQVAAAKAALESVSVALLEDHMQHCVADAIKTGDGTEKVREVSAAIGRLVRS
jgi:DNA-binding FrmR family transcriptional regulator